MLIIIYVYRIYNIMTPNMYHVIIILYYHFSHLPAMTEKVEPGPSPSDLNRRYRPYKRSMRGLCKGIYPQFPWLYMIQYLQFRYLKWSFRNTARMFKNKCLKIIRSHIFSVGKARLLASTSLQPISACSQAVGTTCCPQGGTSETQPMGKIPERM